MNRSVSSALTRAFFPGLASWSRRSYAMESAKAAQSKFLQARKRRNFLILGTLIGFIGGIYYYVIYRVGQDDFADIDKEGNPRVKI